MSPIKSFATVRVLVLPFVLTLALVAAACGDDETSSSQPIPPTATRTATPITEAQATSEPTADAAEQPAMTKPESESVLLIALNEESESGQSGWASVIEEDGGVQVMLHLSEGSMESGLVHVHNGRCGETLGGVATALSDFDGTDSVTLLEGVSLNSLLTGALAINAHNKGDANVFTACGNIPAADNTVIISLEELNESGQSGWATLTSRGDDTEVVALLSPGALESGLIHVHEGTCGPDLAGIAHGLSDFSNGVSVTLLDGVQAGGLLIGGLAINAHSEADPSVYTACGDIPRQDSSVAEEELEPDIIAENFKFVPNTIDVKVGESASFIVTSTGAGHTFTIRSLDVDVVLPSGTTETISFNIPSDAPVELELVCRFHEGAGMIGTIVVEGGTTAEVIDVPVISEITPTPIPAPKYEVWAMDQFNDLIQILDQDFELVDTIDFGAQGLERNHWIDFTSDHEYAWVANTKSANVAIVRSDDRQTVAVLDTGPSSHAANIYPDDSGGIVSVIGTGEIVEIVSDHDNESFSIGRRLILAEDPLLISRAADFGSTNPLEPPKAKPISATFTADGKYAYITLGPALTEGGLVILDVSAFELVKAYPPDEVATNLMGVLSQDGKKMYVNGGSRDTTSFVYVFDTATHELITKDSTRGSDAHGMALTPDGRELWVTNRWSSNIAVFDTETDELKERVHFVGTSPDLLSISPDGKFAFVLLRGAQPEATGAMAAEGDTPGITVVDVRTRTVVTTLLKGEPPEEGGVPELDFHGIDIRPLSAVHESKLVATPDVEPTPEPVIEPYTPTVHYEVWAMDQLNDLMHIVSPQFELVETIDFGAQGLQRIHWIELTSDHKYAWIANTKSANTAIVRTADRQIVAVLDTGPSSHAANIYPDDSGGLVSVIGTGEIVEIVADHANESFSIGRRFILAEDPLIVARASEFGATNPLQPATAKPITATFTADGKYAYITLGPALEDGGLVVLDVEAFELVKVYPPGEVAVNLMGVLSSDGSKMYVVGGSKTATSFVYVFDTTTHELITKDSTRGSDSHGMALTPDGKELWVSNRWSNNVAVFDTETDELKDRVHFVGTSPDLLAISPDGRYAYVLLRGAQPEATGAMAGSGDTPGITVIDVPSRQVIASLLKGKPPEQGQLADIDYHGIAIRVFDGE